MNELETVLREEAKLVKKEIDMALDQMFGHDKPKKYTVGGARVHPIRQTKDRIIVEFPADARQGEPPTLIPTSVGAYELVAADKENLLYRRINRKRVKKEEIAFLP